MMGVCSELMLFVIKSYHCAGRSSRAGWREEAKTGGAARRWGALMR